MTIVSALQSSISTIQLPPLGLIAPPPSGLGWALITAVQAFGTIGRYQQEVNEPIRYSKFSKAASELSKTKDGESSSLSSSMLLLSGRQGMLLAYTPAFLLSTYHYIVTSNQENLAALLLMIHFAKRLLEVMFVHKYSGTMAATLGLGIAAAYSFDTMVISSAAMTMKDLNPVMSQLGLIVYVLGQLGNGYHHYLLSTLRSDTNPTGQKQRYVPPSGGLFQFVAAPHYLFELVSWLGVAMCAQQVNAFLSLLGFISYLMGRSYSANQFYRKTFDPVQWPRTRKNLVPFVW